MRRMGAVRSIGSQPGLVWLGPVRRAAVYGATGSLMESVFTTARLSRNARTFRPSGPASLCVPLIYAFALPLFEPVHDRLRRCPGWYRGALYASGILTVESIAGWAMRRATGRCPWDYTGRTRWHLFGLVRLDYAPFWALAGLGAEWLHDAMVGGPIPPAKRPPSHALESAAVGR